MKNDSTVSEVSCQSKSFGANLNIALVSRLLWLVMSRRVVLRKLSNDHTTTLSMVKLVNQSPTFALAMHGYLALVHSSLLTHLPNFLRQSKSFAEHFLQGGSSFVLKKQAWHVVC